MVIAKACFPSLTMHKDCSNNEAFSYEKQKLKPPSTGATICGLDYNVHVFSFQKNFLCIA